MDGDFSLTASLIQTIIRYGLSSTTWAAIAAVLIAVAVITRIVTGFQSRSGAVSDAEEPRSARMTPYWFPWLGHSLSFAWDHAKCAQSAMLVFPCEKSNWLAGTNRIA